jgi:hypothetical protein
MLFGRKIPKKLLKFSFKKAFEWVTTPIFYFLFVVWQNFTPTKTKEIQIHTRFLDPTQD